MASDAKPLKEENTELKKLLSDRCWDASTLARIEALDEAILPGLPRARDARYVHRLAHATARSGAASPGGRASSRLRERRRSGRNRLCHELDGNRLTDALLTVGALRIEESGDNNLALYVLPPQRPQLNGAVERCNGSWRYEFYAAYDLPHRLDQSCSPSSTPSPTASTTTGRTMLSTAKLRPSISALSARRPSRLICPEPGHSL